MGYVKPDSILHILAAKHPKARYGLQTTIDMDDYKKWMIKRALKVRAAKPKKRFAKRRG